MFTDDCLHSGGPNKTNKTTYRLFAYLTSRLSDIPENGVSIYTFSKAENPKDAIITEVYNKAEEDKLKRQSKAKAYITKRFRTVRPPEYLMNEGRKGDTVESGE